jgi:hypothetical protein
VRALLGGAGGATGGVFVVWLLGHVGVTLTAEDGGVIASGALAAGAYVAHHGVVGVARIVWRGDRQA